jgi:hypothetical protein
MKELRLSQRLIMIAILKSNVPFLNGRYAPVIFTGRKEWASQERVRYGKVGTYWGKAVKENNLELGTLRSRW